MSKVSLLERYFWDFVFSSFSCLSVLFFAFICLDKCIGWLWLLYLQIMLLPCSSFSSLLLIFKLHIHQVVLLYSIYLLHSVSSFSFLFLFDFQFECCSHWHFPAASWVVLSSSTKFLISDTGLLQWYYRLIPDHHNKVSITVKQVT